MSFHTFSEQVPLLSPEAALRHFTRLEPLLGVDPHRFGPDHERQAFTLSAATEETLLERVQELIAEALRTGAVSDAPERIEQLLDEAGVTETNPSYAETVFRTNAADAYNQGSWEEYRAPDVEEDFPAWQYANPDDGRSRKVPHDHGKLNGKFFPASVSFAEVRGIDIGDTANCRCTFIPIYKDRWAKLKAGGARFHRFSERGGPPADRTPTAEATAGKAVAELYADLFNVLGQAGQWPSEDDLHKAHVELQRTDWLVDFDPRAKRWAVRHAGPEAGVHSFAERAPKGGISIAGKFYRGGQWIPNKALEDATPEERAKLDAAKQTHVSKRQARGSVDVAALEAKTAPHTWQAQGKWAKQFGFTPGWERRVFNGLRNYHGELTLHRLEELVGVVHDALGKVDPANVGVRRQLEQRLAAYGRMVQLAKSAGITGQVNPIDTGAKLPTEGLSHGNLDATGGEGAGGGLPPGQQLGTDAGNNPQADQPGAAGGAGAGGQGVPGGEDRERHGAGGSAAGPGHGPEHGPLPGDGGTAAERSLAEAPSPENPTDLSAGNFRYGDRDFLEPGLKAKFKANIAAIQALRAIQAEGRDNATPAEQAVLSRYVGWGQFPGVFNDYGVHQGQSANDWEAERKALKGLLSTEEWEAARRSTLNAHYTHPDVVDAHWRMAERLGFKGGRFLETSAGIGYYLGLMPEHLSGKVKSSAVELDPTTAGMLKLLYPGANVKNQGFEKFQAPDNFYDLVASNVPFGDYKVHDPRYNKHQANIHDYFFLKSLDKVRPGGLVMHITSAGTMDKADPKIREELARQGADLVAAVRFPGGAHQENAGTSVVTDMLIFRKRPANEPPVDPNVTPPEAQPKQPGFTGVTTDSLGRVYHWVDGKRVPGPDWTKATTIPDPDGGEPITVNSYFAAHPDQVLGRIDRSGTMYGAGNENVSLASPEELTEALGRPVKVEVNPHTDKRRFVYADGSPVPAAEIARVGQKLYQEKLEAAIGRLPENVMKPQAASKRAFEPDAQPAPGDVKDGGYQVKDGKVYVCQGGGMVAQDVPAAAAARIQAHLEVRDALRAVIQDETAGRDATASRAKLNEVYDAFVKKYKALNDRANRSAFKSDPDAPVLLALEKYDPKSKKATKADIFSKNVIRHVGKVDKAGSAAEGLGISLHETGGIDLGRIAALTGKGQEEVGAELVRAGLAFQDPQEGWKPADQYLSGNVRRKLAMARAAAEADPRFRANVEALEKVQPQDVEHTEIEARMGASWIPPSDITQFCAELLGLSNTNFRIGYVPATGEWTVDVTKQGKSALGYNQLARNTWGTDRADFLDLLQSALNNKSITVYDKDPDGKSYVNRKATDDANAKAQELKDAFKGWLWEDDGRRERLHRHYNDNFNNVRNLHYDGSHQTFPGMNAAVQLRGHQKDFVWQVVSTGKGLAAHEVGTGKTFSMIAGAMELRRLGLAKKPAIACLKANVEAITRDALHLYPGARILSTADMFDAAKRKETISRIATGDYDMVILTHDHLDLLQMKPETVQAYIKEEIADLEAAKLEAAKADPSKGNKVVKQLEKAKAKLEAKLEEALDASKKDDAVFFEETGIDHIFVDEAHKYKSLPVYTKQDRLKGVPNSRSDRATAMQMRTRWLQENNNGRGVVFATGTPVANTMAELYTMQKYLQPQELKDRGLTAFDAWASNFGDVQTRMEFTVSGEYKPVSRFAKFVNIPELMQMVRQVMDVQRAEDLTKDDGTPAIVRPKRKDHVVTAPKSEAMMTLMASLQNRAKAIKGQAEKGGDNMLNICTDGRKGALDMRLLDPGANDDPDSKTNQCVRNVLDLHKTDPGVTQCVFSDVGVHPSEGGFHLYGDIIDKLVKGGIPREKIADFSQLEGAKKEAAMEAMRKGEILVALGSTEKLGTGVNVQNKLKALHHLDVPWLPSSLEQRDGRGWRQGNENKDIDIYRYVSEGSLDQTFWQVIGNKTRFIRQVVTPGQNVARVAKDEDTEELTPDQLMAAASGDPRILQKVNLEQEVKTLESAAQRHERDQGRLRRNVADQEKQLPRLKQEADRLAEGAKLLDEHPEFAAEIGGKPFTDRKEAEEAFEAKKAEADARASAVSGQRPWWQRQEEEHEESLGTYKGMDIIRKGETGAGKFALRLPNGHEIGTGSTLGSVEAVARRIPKLAQDAEHQAKKQAADLEKVKAGIGKHFPKKDELAAKKAAVASLEKELSAPKEGEDSGEEPPHGKPAGKGAKGGKSPAAPEAPPEPPPDHGAALKTAPWSADTSADLPIAGLHTLSYKRPDGTVEVHLSKDEQATKAAADKLREGGVAENVLVGKAPVGWNLGMLRRQVGKHYGTDKASYHGPAGLSKPAAESPGPIDREAVISDLARLNQRDPRTGLTPTIPSLYDQLKKAHPGLSEERFHGILKNLHQGGAATLQQWDSSVPFAQSGYPGDRFPPHPKGIGRAGWVTPFAAPSQAGGASPGNVARKVESLAARDKNFVSLADLHEAMGSPPLPEFHKAVNDLRRAGAVSPHEWEGRHGPPGKREAAAAIREANSRAGGLPSVLTHLSVSDREALKKVMG
ncbi:MAG: hypothetical protein KGL39_10700 [Patescibacteria group bacterium]|nr:hypothetical protein [Patescibacteria group bacterium]